MKAHAPFEFSTGQNLDLQRLNETFRQLSRDINRNLSQRFTYSRAKFSLTTAVTATPEVQRTFYVRRPGTDNAVEVIGVELRLFGNAAGTATVTCSDSTWPTLSLTTSASTTTECYTSSFRPVSVPSSSSDVTFVVAFPAAYTVTAGDLIVHTRCDRGNQGSSHADFNPTLFASTATAADRATDANALFTAAEAAVSADSANDKDLRLETFVVRGLGAGLTRTFRLASGARRLLRVQVYTACDAGEEVRATLSGSGLTSVAVQVAGTSVSAIATGGAAAGATATTANDPMDSTDDVTLEIAEAGAGDVDFTQVNVWWS